MPPTCTLKDMLDSKDQTVSWGPIYATVVKAPTTVKSSPGNYGDWVRATFTLQAEGTTLDLIWTDPTPPYLDNPKSLEGCAVVIAQGAKLEEYKGTKRLKAKEGQVQILPMGGPVSSPPAPTSHVPAPIQAPSPGQAHPLMGSDRSQITDRALLQAYAAWGPQLWAILDPGMQAAPGTAQAVAAAMNTMTIAAGQGKLVITMFAEPGE